MLCFVFALVTFQHASVTLRGVAPQDLDRYNEAVKTGQFQCSGGVISASAINDDYCDCDDGSDEPGTSACENSRFYCRNVGFSPITLFASRVNDGVCDCCDGTDEWTGVVSCQDTCHRDGAQYRADLLERIDKLKQGLEHRNKLTSEAQAIKTMKQESITALEETLAQQIATVATLTMDKEEKEKVEKATRDAKLAEWEAAEDARIAALKAEFPEASEPKETEAQPESQKKEANEEAKEEDEAPVAVAVGGAGDSVDLMNAAVSTGEPATCLGWRQTGGCVASGPREPQFDEPCDGIIASGKSGFCECVSEIRVEYTCTHPSFTCQEVCDKRLLEIVDQSDYEVLDENDLNGSEPSSPTPTPDPFARVPMSPYTDEEASKAREALRLADAEKRETEAKLTKLQGDLALNYGPNDVYLPLHGKCAELDVNRYQYKVCLFTDTTQHDGHSQIRLGGFEALVDNTMTFTHGQRCWNGPDRSAKVEFACGPEFKLLSASEPEKCTYLLQAEAPAACSQQQIEALQKELGL